jgi:hypothetical protein
LELGSVNDAYITAPKATKPSFTSLKELQSKALGMLIIAKASYHGVSRYGSKRKEMTVVWNIPL